MNAEKKEALGLSKEDWIEIQQKGHWYGSFDQTERAKYLGVSVGEMLVETHMTSVAGSLPIRFVMEEYLKTNFKINKTTNFQSDSEYPPVFTNIEYEYKKYRNCPATAQFFLETNDGERFVCSVESSGPYQVAFSVSGKREGKTSCRTVIDSLATYARENNFLRGKKIDTHCNFIYFDNPYNWDDLILPKEVKDSLRKNLSNIIDFREVYKANNLGVKRGLILQGEPGTGKSLLGKILCCQIDWTFMWVTAKDFNSAEDVSRVITACKDLSPCILFLEDIDLYGGHRESNPRSSLLGELMNRLDGIQENQDIITIATTNDIKVLEKALVSRPGRFDCNILFPPPDETGRAEMLRRFGKTLNLNPDLIKEIASASHGLTGAQMRELVNMAVIVAVDDRSYDKDTKKLDMKLDHFKQSVKTVKSKNFNQRSVTVGFSVGTTNSATPDLY